MPATTVQTVDGIVRVLKRRLEIAAQVQLPGDSAVLIVEEFRKLTQTNGDAYVVLEVLIEQTIIAHRLRYTETQAYRSNVPDCVAWVTKKLVTQAKLLCETSEMWLDAKEKITHSHLRTAVNYLLSDIHGLNPGNTARELVSIWQQVFNISLQPTWFNVLISFISTVIFVHIRRVLDGETDEKTCVNLAFARRGLVFRLGSVQAVNVREELGRLEECWRVAVKE